jgi:uncharacterized protein YjbJ (UPF0337 family)
MPDCDPGDWGLPAGSRQKQAVSALAAVGNEEGQGGEAVPDTAEMARRESTMRSRGRDKAGGALDKVRGRIREAGGALTGSDRDRTKGAARQGRGEARKKRGHLRDLFKK